MVAAVGCAIDDAVINHTVLILKGKQGVGKSSFLLNLPPKELRGYIYSGVLNPSDKDTMSNLAECFLINLDELETLSKFKEGALKEIITKSSIRIRRPYSRFSENLTRHASFTGSVNHTNILHDSTGSRRFLIHEATSIDYEHDIDINLVWAQAYALFKSNYKFYFDMEEIKKVNSQNSAYEVNSVEEELLLKNFEPADKNNKNPIKRTATDILTEIQGGDIPKNSRGASITLGRALSKHNFEFSMIKGSKYYHVKPIYNETNIFDE